MVSRVNLLILNFTADLVQTSQSVYRKNEVFNFMYAGRFLFSYNFDQNTLSTNLSTEFSWLNTGYNTSPKIQGGNGLGLTFFYQGARLNLPVNNQYNNARNFELASGYGYLGLFSDSNDFTQIYDYVNSGNSTLYMSMNMKVNKYGGIDHYIPYMPYFSPVSMFDTSSNIMSNDYNDFAINFASNVNTCFFTYYNLDERKWENTTLLYNGNNTGSAFVPGTLNRSIILAPQYLDNIYFDSINQYNATAFNSVNNGIEPLNGEGIQYWQGVGAILLGKNPSDVPYFSPSPRFQKLSRYIYPVNSVIFPTNGGTFYPRVVLSFTKGGLLGIGLAYDSGASPEQYALQNNISQNEIDTFINMWGKLAYYGGYAIESNNHNDFIEFYDSGIINDITTPAASYLVNPTYYDFKGDSVNVFYRYISKSGKMRAIGYDSNPASPHYQQTVFLEVGFSYALPAYVRNFSRGFLA